MPIAGDQRHRVRLFVDYWNFVLALPRGFRLDWQRLGPSLTEATAFLVRHPCVYEGLHVYTSFDPMNQNDTRFRQWAKNTLDHFPGVELVMKERKTKRAPSCRACQYSIEVCPQCRANMHGTVEKGVDTALVTDMIRLAWEESYDLAVLVSSDRDFIPAIEFLNTKGRRVINVCFPPRGSELAAKCWASIDMTRIYPTLER